MSENSREILDAVRKIHELLELLAEDKIAERDAKQRSRLVEIVGSSVQMQNSVVLMDGTRTQKDIHDATKVNRGNLSTMVGKLQSADLLVGDTKSPKLAIAIPANFFEKQTQTK
jgi:hypothetical protein